MPSPSTTSLKLNAEIEERVQRLSEARRRSSHWIMREAIEKYVAREEKRRSFLQDAQKAWDEFERTGLHLTGEEVEGWMREVENGEDAPMPECHT